MANPIWYTEAGSLGTYPSTSSVSIQLSATAVAPATTLTFNINGGTLPLGFIMNSNGLIYGVSSGTTFNQFSVRITDNLGNSSTRVFSISIGLAQPIWNTVNSDLGGFASAEPMFYQLSASAVYPGLTISYELLSGSLPPGITLDSSGLISGTPSPVYENTEYTFVVRAIDNLQNVRDKTFMLTVTGVDAPEFVTPAGTIKVTYDSTWVEIPIEYTIPVSGTEVFVRQVAGILPPGLEINEFGVIRGYAEPPTLNENLGEVDTSAIAINNNNIVVYSLNGFEEGRPVVFSGTVFGGIEAGKVYYVKTIDINTLSFTISTTANGSVVELDDDAGFMDVTLPNITVGQPVVKTFSFTLKLYSVYGTDIQNYSITVVNQNAPPEKGGPGLLPNTRVPTILNTRPLSYDIYSNNMDYIFYLLPPDSNGLTYSPSTPAYIGRISSDNRFNFQILGYDFDGNELEYVFADLPLGLVGDSTTGWITGNPQIATDSVSQFTFSVAARKKANPVITTPSFYFTFKIRNGITGDIIWATPSDLGIVYNGTTSTLFVDALSDVELQYELMSGSLPPNLTLLPTGELSGTIAFQPSETLTLPNEDTTFTFTIRAYSPIFPSVTSDQTFTVTVNQLFPYPCDTLYIKCTPGTEDRNLINSLLSDDYLIPNEYLYRPDDPNFGKASNVTYVHAYGINSSSFDSYIEAVTKNHYWRNITLGEIKTAIARNNAGEIIYEVVYSSVIDNLINPQGISVSKEVFWPRYIPLGLGPWYTSDTDIFTSYIGDSQYYTSLTPGFTNTLYPNSLPNMREQVGDVLGQVQNTNLLPLWMTSQQLNGSTTGFIPAWVICYTRPGFGEIIKNRITNEWTNPVGQIQTLNEIDFKIDRFAVDKSNTYNYDNNLSPPAYTSLPSGSPVPDPVDSYDFYVLFPRRTILPDSTDTQL